MSDDKKKPTEIEEEALDEVSGGPHWGSALKGRHLPPVNLMNNEAELAGINQETITANVSFDAIGETPPNEISYTVAPLSKKIRG